MKRKMPFIAALSILCWGCSSYDYSGDDIVGVKAAISGTITEVVEKSRTVGTTWTDGDRIGVTCEDDVNISYKYTGNLSSFAAFDENQSIYFLGKQEHVLSAYYPFTETSVMVADCITVETTSDKQTQEKQMSIDFLYATTEAGRNKPDVNFAFSHQMSRIDFSFEGKDGLTLDDITYTLIGLKLKGTFNTIDGTTAVVEDAPALALSQKVMVGENMRTSLIVFPQKVSEVTFEIEMGGKSFIKKIGEMDLVPGHIHPYTVIISERDETIYVTVESGEVQGWVEGDRQEINTSDGNTITGVEPGDVQWDGGNTQTIVSQGGRSISMELYDN